jgi:hypothetical protein
VFEVICAFGWLELFEDDFEGVVDGIKGSGFGSSEQRLEFGKDKLDGVEVGLAIPNSSNSDLINSLPWP